MKIILIRQTSNQRIAEPFFENGIDPTQKEQINQRIAHSFNDKGFLAISLIFRILLVEKVSEWTLLEDPTQETIDMVKETNRPIDYW